MKAITSFFAIDGVSVSCKKYGNGHINETYQVITDTEKYYILQKINHRIFGNVPALMSNISAISQWIASIKSKICGTLNIVPTIDGKTFYKDPNGCYWRVYDFVLNSVCLERAITLDDYYQSAVGFGGFQRSLAEFPTRTLHETIPKFHNTSARYMSLHQAANTDMVGRLKKIGPELTFALEREAQADELQALLQNGSLPLRVTHNDTKLNNVLLDVDSHKPLCVIDLDTVMPGLVANDFGDAIRFGASTAAEDESDLSLVHFSLELYEAFLTGYLDTCGDALTKLEIKTLPIGAKLMTLECGVRFLTDYLNGDVYFATHRKDHNLIRCRTQFALLRDMERNWVAMNRRLSKV